MDDPNWLLDFAFGIPGLFGKEKKTSQDERLDFSVRFDEMLKDYRETHEYEGTVLVLFPASYREKLESSCAFIENDTHVMPQVFGFMAGRRAAVGISDDVYMQIQFIQVDDEWQVSGEVDDGD